MQIVTSQPNQQETKPAKPTALSMPVGQPFSVRNSSKYPNPIHIRVKPTGFVLNSSVIGDVINRGDIFTVNLNTCTLAAMRGQTEVVLREAHVVVTDQ